jgi:hypothetical protein
MDTTPVDSLNPIRSNKLRPTKIFDDDREVRWGNKFHPGGEFAGGGVGDAEAARIAGVNGVPFFVTNGQPAFSGARAYSGANRTPFQSMSDSDSNPYRTAFRLISDRIPG